MSTLSSALRLTASEVLRCHGFEKNLQAISLSGPEMIADRLEHEPQLKALLSAEAKEYVDGAFPAEFKEYRALVDKVAARNGGKPDAITEEETARHLELDAKIRNTLAAPVILAVLQDSGLVSAEDVAAKRVSANRHGMVSFSEDFTASEAQLKTAREYVNSRQPVRQADGSWRSHAAQRGQNIQPGM